MKKKLVITEEQLKRLRSRLNEQEVEPEEEEPYVDGKDRPDSGKELFIKGNAGMVIYKWWISINYKGANGEDSVEVLIHRDDDGFKSAEIASNDSDTLSDKEVLEYVYKLGKMGKFNNLPIYVAFDVDSGEFDSKE